MDKKLTVYVIFPEGSQITFENMFSSIIDQHLVNVINVSAISTASMEPGVPEVIGDVIVKVMDH